MSASSTQPVFLSYAREDAAAARRIADALRAFGVEVWFDQNELRGGDSWDTNIKKQIRECALFVPIVSARTQARAEGYFRREWKLAAERTHDMAASRAFLLPIVIDDTRESGAEVPDEFMRVQWTRLENGVPSPEFVAQVRRLLDRSVGAAGGVGTTLPRRAPGNQPAGPISRTPLVISAAVGGAVAVALFVWFGATKSPTGAGVPTAAAPATAPRSSAPTKALAKEDKSIAVLPFDNLSDAKEAAYFADGVHEDLLASLQLIADLKVIGDRSVRQYRDTTKSTRQIGEELGVAYVLQGSVRLAGGSVKVVGKLIEARSNQQVWAKSYERDLAKVFAIQSELAQEIAGALQAVLSPEAKSLVERRPTDNPEAYKLYLRARELARDFDVNVAQLERQVVLWQSVVELDSKFAEAWARLGQTHSLIYNNGSDRTEARRQKAEAAINRAAALAPDSPVVLGALGMFHFDPRRDMTQAVSYFQKQAALQPGNADPLILLADAERRRLQHPIARTHLQKAAVLDPADPRVAYHLADIYHEARRYDDSIAEQRRVVTLKPRDRGEAFFVVNLEFYARGSRTEGDAFFANFPVAQREADPEILGLRKSWARQIGDFEEVIRIDQRQRYVEFAENMDSRETRRQQAIRVAIVYLCRGDRTAARDRLERFPEECRAQLLINAANDIDWSDLADMELVLGNAPEALRCANKALELTPASVNAFHAGWRRYDITRIQAWSDQKDAALAELERLLKIPIGIKVHRLRVDPWWFPLRGNARFEALLNDPKNHAPLF
jgi:TolB-like protein/cytochrome c-type biogenesis protein CcmH/NrfG